MSMPEILPPEILTAAGSAWDKAHERQETASQGFGSAALFGALDGAVSEAMERGGVGFNGLENRIANPEIRELFERDLEDYETIFAGAGIDMPTPAELARGGIDFGRLAELKEKLPDYDLVVTPLTLPLDSVYQLVSTVARDKTIPGNPFKAENGRSNNGKGLYVPIPDGMWDRAMASVTQNWRLPTTDGEYRWTAFLLPNNNETLGGSPSYIEVAQEDRITAPAPGYIAYQVHRARMGMLPLKLHHRVKRVVPAISGELDSLSADSDDTFVLTADWDNYYDEIYVSTANISLLLEHQNQPKARIYVDVRLCAPVG